MEEAKWKSLFRSIRWRDNKRAKDIIDTGLEVNSYNASGTTVLSYAAECGNLEIVKYLIMKEADLNIANSDGSKPLHMAAKHGHQDVFKYFLSSGVSVDLLDVNNNTSLHFLATITNPLRAARENYREFLVFLLNCGSNINAQNKDGETPLLVAVRKRRTYFIELFVQLGAKRDGAMHVACKYQWSNGVIILKKMGCDINDQANCGRQTPLHLSRSLKIDMIINLLEAGVDCNLRDVHGVSGFHCFLDSRSWAISLKQITLFVNKGAYFQLGPNGENMSLSDIFLAVRLLEIGIFQNVELCTKIIINKYNYQDLPKLFEVVPGISQILPNIEQLKISNNSNAAKLIAVQVKNLIQNQNHCNVERVFPSTLAGLSVQYLTNRYRYYSSCQ